MMKGAHCPTAAAFALLALATFHLVSAFDPSPLQDFCVALNTTNTDISAVFVNGRFCKDPKMVTPEDFFFSGLRMRGNTSNPLGSIVTQANVQQIAGLNTLGVSLARIDYALGGLNPPHIHPRATEVLRVMEGTLYVGFVTSNDNGNRLFSKVLYEGDVFVFPFAQIHFQLNIGKVNAVAISSFSSQFPGVTTIANAVFGSNPSINPDVLTKAFQVDKNVVQYLQNQFWYDNN
ncbi:germin-like protein subfamily 1 member 18 [Rosa rugosa]|uniref:germin-like protein subfamily 1 member 18 n=1 Tax=Rosa rugosa TaxID=74645 RepID=UPI002B410867|nr:germin-like protein subfamily 1 member 18 [Rosa rugosa]